MIKEAIAYITGLAVKAEKPEIVEIAGRTYCTRDLTRYGKPDKAKPIEATTLSSLVDYIIQRRDELREHMIIQIVSPTEVRLYSGLLEERDREELFIAKAMLPHFDFGTEYDQEHFLVSLQACFKDMRDEFADDREAVAVLASNVVNTQAAQYSDDGITQQAVIKTGITTKEQALVPNPVRLTPYRTFLEVEQPQSEFVFRIGEGRGGAPTFKLVSADGGLWKAEAVEYIRAYLEKNLEDITNREQITIIA